MIYGIRPRWGSLQRSPIPPSWAGGGARVTPPGPPTHYLFICRTVSTYIPYVLIVKLSFQPHTAVGGGYGVNSSLIRGKIGHAKNKKQKKTVHTKINNDMQ